jgi:TPR repeat protein
MNNLALIYQNGDGGIKVDIEKAIQLFEQASDLGNEGAKKKV